MKLDDSASGDTLLGFTVWIDLSGLAPTPEATGGLFGAIREDLFKRATSDLDHDLRPHVHFLRAA